MKKIYKKWWFWVILLIIAIVLFIVIINFNNKSYERLEIKLEENMTSGDYCKIVFDESNLDFINKLGPKVYAKWHDESTIDISLMDSSSCMFRPSYSMQVKDNQISIKDSFFSRIKFRSSPQVDCIFTRCEVLRIKNMPNKNYDILFRDESFYLEEELLKLNLQDIKLVEDGKINNGVLLGELEGIEANISGFRYKKYIIRDFDIVFQDKKLFNIDKLNPQLEKIYANLNNLKMDYQKGDCPLKSVPKRGLSP